MTTLFDDLPPPPPVAETRIASDENYRAPAAHRHNWYPDSHVWTGETFARLVWRCKTCPELRGRC